MQSSVQFNLTKYTLFILPLDVHSTRDKGISSHKRSQSNSSFREKKLALRIASHTPESGKAELNRKHGKCHNFSTALEIMGGSQFLVRGKVYSGKRNAHIGPYYRVKTYHTASKSKEIKYFLKQLLWGCSTWGFGMFSNTVITPHRRINIINNSRVFIINFIYTYIKHMHMTLV